MSRSNSNVHRMPIRQKYQQNPNRSSLPTPSVKEKRVMVLELEAEPVTAAYLEFLSELPDQFDVLKPKSVRAALSSMVDASNPISSILIWEPSIVDSCAYVNADFAFEPDHGDIATSVLADAIVDFTKAGGTTVFAVAFAKFANRDNLNHYFEETWNLPWRYGYKGRMDLSLNQKSTFAPLAYEMNVEGPDEMETEVTSLSGSARQERVYFAEASYKDQESRRLPASSPVVFRKYGKGHIGYVGDHDCDEALQEIVLAMLDC